MITFPKMVCSARIINMITFRKWSVEPYIYVYVCPFYPYFIGYILALSQVNECTCNMALYKDLCIINMITFRKWSVEPYIYVYVCPFYPYFIGYILALSQVNEIICNMAHNKDLCLKYRITFRKWSVHAAIHMHYEHD